MSLKNYVKPPLAPLLVYIVLVFEFFNPHKCLGNIKNNDSLGDEIFAGKERDAGSVSSYKGLDKEKEPIDVLGDEDFITKRKRTKHHQFKDKRFERKMDDAKDIFQDHVLSGKERLSEELVDVEKFSFEHIKAKDKLEVVQIYQTPKMLDCFSAPKHKSFEYLKGYSRCDNFLHGKNIMQKIGSIGEGESRYNVVRDKRTKGAIYDQNNNGLFSYGEYPDMQNAGEGYHEYDKIRREMYRARRRKMNVNKYFKIDERIYDIIDKSEEQNNRDSFKENKIRKDLKIVANQVVANNEAIRAQNQAISSIANCVDVGLESYTGTGNGSKIITRVML